MENTAVENKEKYILVAVSCGDEEAAWRSLEELAELLDTAGGETACMVVQNLEHPDRATYIGSGKAQELREMLEQQDAIGVIADDELTPSQFRNLSDAIDAKVLDRTMLILDIFARHATTGEGKIQVEIAQQKYRLSRLRGMGEAMSRLGGGIGTRGPGETKLETDRRVIQRRIKILSDEIEHMKQSSETTRKKRTSSAVPMVAIVGYTNAGKSTMLNALTGASVLSEDKLFATLDPTTRVATLPDGQQVLLTDTVGFINKLPHNIIDAFRSTLEEAKFADVIVHVVDASDEMAELHCEVVDRTLRELDVVGKPIIIVKNKMDLVRGARAGIDGEEATAESVDEKASGGIDGKEAAAREARAGIYADELLVLPRADAVVEMSARQGSGVDDFYDALARILRANRTFIDTVLSYTETARLARIRKYGQLLSEEYEADGIHIRAYVPEALK